MTSSPRLRDDPGELINLSLRTAESTELKHRVSVSIFQFTIKGFPYPPLGELPSPLVGVVAEQFNDTLLIWGETANNPPLAIRPFRFPFPKPQVFRNSDTDCEMIENPRGELTQQLP